MPSTTIADLARLLGITQTAAARHAKAVGGAAALAAKVQENLNHLLAGGSRRTAPGGLPGFMTAAVEATAEGKTAPTFTTRKPAKGRQSPSRLLQPPTKEEESEWSEEWLCPFSSNVYSYQFHQTPGVATGTLFVTFRAAVLNTSNLGHGSVKRGKNKSERQLVGTGGPVHAKGWARPFSEGSRYAYFDVPKKVYQQMRDAHSKGGAVWDLLRVRGSVSGHRFKYSLVSGQVLTGKGGVYIARKATAKGFRTRSLAVAGQGKRGFLTSTLPASASGGFTTRRGPK